MGRRIASRALVAAVLIGLGLGAADASAARRSGVSGRVVLDGACLTPSGYCTTVPAKVKILRARSGKLVKTVHAAGGRFHVRLRPGRYRLRATADSGNGAGSSQVRVRRHRVTTVVVRLRSPVP